LWLPSALVIHGRELLSDFKKISILEKILHTHQNKKFMDIKSFINKIENEIEELTPGSLTPETEFTSIKEWSSMHLLILIALIDVEYSVTITGADLQGCKSVNDLFNLIKSRV
jgi:acyl carrier protein